MGTSFVPAGSVAPPGLKGLIVADTAVGSVLGEEGWYHYRGRDAVELARTLSFEAIACLLIDGAMPDSGAEAAFAKELASHRELSPEAHDLVVRLSRTSLDPLAVLASVLPLVVDQRPTIDMTHDERRNAVLQAIGAARPRSSKSRPTSAARSSIGPSPSRPICCRCWRSASPTR